jgi:tRNA/rRNA methyltransferase
MGENIGAAARAMKNFCLDDLRIVNPRDIFPNDKAYAMASGADIILDNAKVFSTFEDVIADLHIVYATTSRLRDMEKPIFTPKQAIERIKSENQEQQKIGFVFGGERAGLENEHVTLCNAILRIPVNPEFASLNLAQSVLLLGYHWFQATYGDEQIGKNIIPIERATQQELHYMFEHLETSLDKTNFFFPPEKRESMVRNLRNIFVKADLNTNEVRTLRGIIRSLTTRYNID